MHACPLRTALVSFAPRRVRAFAHCCCCLAVNRVSDEEGDSVAFQSKLTGAGSNDMCNMQELTKDSILGLLKDRFKKEIVYT